MAHCRQLFGDWGARMSILLGFRHSDSRLYARVVRWFRGGDTAHCEAGIPDAGGNRLSLCFSSSYTDGGVRGKIIDMSDPHKWRVYWWVNEYIDPMEWLRPHFNDGYDLLGCVGIVAPRVGEDRGKKFCSEACAEIMKLTDPHTYDPVRLESHVRQHAKLVVWVGGKWVPFESANLTPRNFMPQDNGAFY